ncbi:hypothetical protein A0H81_02036 [Grifola frondosa]|uniref:DUF6533 domain-containing protein n=1 Tax=Grifola frondosa TaxID=5627 RepID=A0A1C7MS98_GRIFR|nr:hypothetical protein A0H81_02036 [Grifola frondosa]
MSALSIPINEPLGIVVADGLAVNVMTLVGFTALVYNHLLTFVDEVDLVWRPRIGVVSSIFLINRYGVPLVLIVDLYESFGLANNATLFCKAWTILQSYLTIASFMSIHAVVAWRLYAIYNGRRAVGRLLCAAGTVYAVSSTGITTACLIPIISELRPYHHACVGTVPDYLWSIWLPSVVFESFLFVLTVNSLRRQRNLTSLSLLLYRDGMLYFVAVTLCSLFSLLVWALAGPTFLGLARYFALAMVNIAGARLILNLKAFAAARRDNTSWETTSPRSLDCIATAGLFGDSGAPRGDAVDVEMYSIERECQQLGTRLR